MIPFINQFLRARNNGLYSDGREESSEITEPIC